jgi:GAF domain-containing protein
VTGVKPPPGEIELNAEGAGIAPARATRPVYDPGPMPGEGSLEATLEQLERLQHLTVGLAETATTTDVIRAVERLVPAVVGAPPGAAALVEPADRPRRWRAAESGAPPSWERGPDRRDPLVAQVIERGETSERVTADAVEAAVPVMPATGAVGALTVRFPLDDDRSAGDRRSVLLDIAALVAPALARAHRFDAEIDARRRAEEAQARLAFLAEVSNAVASSLAMGELLERLCAVGLPRLGDWCTIFLPDGVVLERVAGLHRDSSMQHLVDRLIGKFPVPLANASPIARTYRTREVAVFPAVDRELVSSIIDDPAYTDTVLELSQGGGMIVPLLVRGRPIGVMAFGLEAAGRTFSDDDVWLAKEMARRAAVGIDNATKYQQQHLVAELFQRAVLPEQLPAPSGVDLAARYLPAGPGVEVGGDWYDAFGLDDGSLALVIGDVAGHDFDAASTMAQLRNALRAYAFEGETPSAVLRQLNRLLCRTTDPLFASAVVAVLSPDRRRLTWANAGHLPPLLVRPGAVESLTEPHGVLLGVRSDVDYPEGAIDLTEGNVLLLYTDGLIERRDEPIDAGLQRLERITAAAAEFGPSADAVSERLLERLLAGQARTDDVCLVTAWLTADEPALDFDLDPEPSSSRAARARVHDALAKWDGGELVDPVELLE